MTAAGSDVRAWLRAEGRELAAAPAVALEAEAELPPLPDEIEADFPLPRSRPYRGRGTLAEMAERPCPCDVCAAREEVMAVRDLVPGELPMTPESQVLHEAETARELALWHALVWAPEAAAEAAQFRPDDRAAGSAWSRLRAVLDALGLVEAERRARRTQRKRSPVARWLEVCLHTGPPAVAAALGAPVISP